MDGTCSGEHGIGSGKLDFPEAEHPTGFKLMHRLKRVLDPQNIMNPGVLGL